MYQHNAMKEIYFKTTHMKYGHRETTPSTTE